MFIFPFLVRSSRIYFVADVGWSVDYGLRAIVLADRNDFVSWFSRRSTEQFLPFCIWNSPVESLLLMSLNTCQFSIVLFGLWFRFGGAGFILCSVPLMMGRSSMCTCVTSRKNLRWSANCTDAAREREKKANTKQADNIQVTVNLSWWQHYNGNDDDYIFRCTLAQPVAKIINWGKTTTPLKIFNDPIWTHNECASLSGSMAHFAMRSAHSASKSGVCIATTFVYVRVERITHIAVGCIARKTKVLIITGA